MSPDATVSAADPKGGVLLPKQKSSKSKVAAAKDAAAAAAASPEAVAELREQGNALFRKGDYAAAAGKYSECIKVDENDSAALSNRAECFLRARQFHNAYNDAHKSFEADPSHAKSLYKKAMAANGLGRYAEAIKLLKELVALAPEDKAAASGLAECELLQDQAFMGKYDMGALYFGGLTTSFRRCADHVGAVKIAEAAGCGRGLFVTKAVKAGDLLVVSSPLAVAPLKTGSEISLVQGLMGMAARNPQDLALLLDLPTSSSGAANARIPDLTRFRRHLHKPTDQLPELPPQEMMQQHCWGIVKTCAIRGRGSIGIWGLPSFINHSCVPSAHRVMVGHTMFLRASKDMAAGEEVTMKYFEVMMPKPDRNAVAKKWGFACECPRCKLEGIGEKEEEVAKADKAMKESEEALKKKSTKKGGSENNKEENKEEEGAAAPLTEEEITNVSMLVGALRVQFKSLHKELGEAIEVLKKTKGREIPNSNELVELAQWYEDRIRAFKLPNKAQEAWVRCSAMQLYFNLSLVHSATGQLEERHRCISAIIDDVKTTEPGSLEHCKQTVIFANNAKRAFGNNTPEHGAASAECVAAHRLRYGGDLEDVHLFETIDRTNHTTETASGEFCEA